MNTNSEIMNLIGYGLAKFDLDFVREFGFSTKASFAQFIVNLGLANTIKAVSNRQDFDPYFDNGRRGWYQRNQREHIKLFIDSLFGKENAAEFSDIVKLYIKIIIKTSALQQPVKLQLLDQNSNNYKKQVKKLNFTL